MSEGTTKAQREAAAAAKKAANAAYLKAWREKNRERVAAYETARRAK
jgi:hypothetical protein